MTRPSLAGIEKRAAAATTGPWFEDDDGGVSTEPTVLSMTVQRIVDTEGCGMHEGNRALIAQARTDLPALTAAIRDVLALADSLDRLSSRHPDSETGCIETTVAHELRTALAAHLDLTDPEGDPS